MSRRIDLIIQDMQDRDIDVAFLHTADNVYYVTGVPLLSGWGRPMWAVMWPDRRVAVVGSMIERESMERYAWASDVLAYDDEENVWDASLKIVSELMTADAPTPKRIGVEQTYLAVDT